MTLKAFHRAYWREPWHRRNTEGKTIWSGHGRLCHWRKAEKFDSLVWALWSALYGCRAETAWASITYNNKYKHTDRTAVEKLEWTRVAVASKLEWHKLKRRQYKQDNNMYRNLCRRVYLHAYNCRVMSAERRFPSSPEFTEPHKFESNFFILTTSPIPYHSSTPTHEEGTLFFGVEGLQLHFR